MDQVGNVIGLVGGGIENGCLGMAPKVGCWLWGCWLVWKVWVIGLTVGNDWLC